MSSFEREFRVVYERVRQDPFELCREFKFHPTSQQADAIALVKADNDLPPAERLRRIAIKSGQGPGKTTISTIIGTWRTLLGPGARTIVTAPTMRQCTDVWIAELVKRCRAGSGWLRRFIKINKTSVTIAGMNGWGIKCVTATRPENMQGYHDKYLTIIMEEASGIDRAIWEQCKGTLTNERSLLFAIGNPNTRDCAFFDCFNSQRHMWHTLTLNAEDSPIVDKKNLKAIEGEFGRDSDVYRVRVLGEFPDIDPNCVMSSEDLEACTKTNYLDAALLGVKENPEQCRAIGIDFARYGSDENVIFRRYGYAVVEWSAFGKTDPSIAVEAAFRMQHEASWKDEETYYIADAGGIGQGVMHRFYRAQKRIHEFHTQGTPADPTKYKNKMSEAWFHLAKLVKRRVIHIPNDNQLIHQLSTRQYYIGDDGLLAIESKEDYVKRVEMENTSSPDRADAIVMCFYLQGIVQGSVSSLNPSRGDGWHNVVDQ